MDRILLIDDDVGTLEGVGLLLRMAPYEVVGARTGQAGVLMAKEVHPTFAFIDLKLPDMSGLDVLRELRVGVPDTRCIIVTGFGSCKSVVEALRLGACDYLEKPLSADDLVESMKKALVSPTPNEFLSESQPTFSLSMGSRHHSYDNLAERSANTLRVGSWCRRFPGCPPELVQDCTAVSPAFAVIRSSPPCCPATPIQWRLSRKPAEYRRSQNTC